MCIRDRTITHFMSDCPRLLQHRAEALPAGVPTDDMKWSVREILNFTYHPGVNEAYEGTWNNSDHRTTWGPCGTDESLSLDWLEDESGDENNNDVNTG